MIMNEKSRPKLVSKEEYLKKTRALPRRFVKRNWRYKVDPSK